MTFTEKLYRKGFRIDGKKVVGFYPMEFSRELIKKENFFTASGSLKKDYLNALKKLSLEEDLKIEFNLLKKSLERIKAGEEEGWDEKRSLEEGVRQALITREEAKNQAKMSVYKGKKSEWSIKLPSSAKSQDEEHLLFDFKKIKTSKCLKLLERWGCQCGCQFIFNEE